MVIIISNYSKCNERIEGYLIKGNVKVHNFVINRQRHLLAASRKRKYRSAGNLEQCIPLPEFLTVLTDPNDREGNPIHACRDMSHKRICTRIGLHHRHGWPGLTSVRNVGSHVHPSSSNNVELRTSRDIRCRRSARTIRSSRGVVRNRLKRCRQPVTCEDARIVVRGNETICGTNCTTTRPYVRLH